MVEVLRKMAPNITYMVFYTCIAHFIGFLVGIFHMLDIKVQCHVTNLQPQCQK